MSENNTNKSGMIILIVFLIICGCLGITAFVLTFTKKCNEGFNKKNLPYRGYTRKCGIKKRGLCIKVNSSGCNETTKSKLPNVIVNGKEREVCDIDTEEKCNKLKCCEWIEPNQWSEP